MLQEIKGFEENWVCAKDLFTKNGTKDTIEGNQEKVKTSSTYICPRLKPALWN